MGPQYLRKLEGLWQKLAEPGKMFDLEIGPYPADHGIRHITNVLNLLANLLDGSKKAPDVPTLTPRDYALLFASAMVHDVGMTRMRSLGSYGTTAAQIRLEHAREDIIRSIAAKTLGDFFEQSQIEEIVLVASAHAKDDRETVEKKIERAVNGLPVADKRKITFVIRLLGLADFLDIGPNRLTWDANDQRWEGAQLEHLQKHRILRTPVIRDDLVLLDLRAQVHQDFTNACNLNLGDDEQILDPAWEPTQRRLMKCVGTLHKTREDLELMLKDLNSVAGCEWQLRPLDEELFGRICPLSAGMDLFSRELNAARGSRKLEGPFEIDWMGHSLFQRFFSNAERLNAEFQKMLSNSELVMRVLLLDPNFEGQQACEVYEAQSVPGTQEEKDGRSILPLRNQKGSIANGGDIRTTLDSLMGEPWRSVGNSLLEVRGTRRLLYASMVRFGNRMLVTPYRYGGLFNQSGALLFTNMSPLFHAYRAEFASIWRHTEETRLLVHKAGNPSATLNPISHLIQNGVSAEPSVPSFNYERWLLREPNRIKAWLSKKVIPPFEIEVQPTTYCSLRCTHCIGRQFSAGNSAPGSRLTTADLRHFESVFQWKQGKLKVERIRISGLTGDPLEKGACEFTKALIGLARKAKRQVVIFTNGTTLGIRDVRQTLTAVDYVHISLDAASAKTFYEIKGTDVFRDILQHTRKLCREIEQDELATKVGFGFVVTRQNFEEVGDAVRVAGECGVHFIRFRRDIQRPDAIGWRQWREARRNILKQRDVQGKTLPEIWITDIQRSHWSPHTDDCLSQRYYVTVGPDGLVYPCDHLTGMGEACALGDLRKLSLKKIFEKASGVRARNRLCAVGLYCSQCPPFNQRANRLLTELKVLYDQYPWRQLKEWIAQPTKAMRDESTQCHQRRYEK